MSNNHENDLSPSRRYRKYEHLYNAAFAADPNPETRKFQELAPEDSAQWTRLEVYRGNDKDAYDAHRSNPNDALVRPTAKEEAMWKANADDLWRINREPPFGKHENTNSKWLDMTPQQRLSDKGQEFLSKVEQKYAPSYDQWAARAGSNKVDQKSYIEGLTAVAQEHVMASRSRTAPVNEQAAPTRSRISLANFNGTGQQFVADQVQKLRDEPVAKLDQVIDQAKRDHQATTGMSVEQGAKRAQDLLDYQQRTVVRSREQSRQAANEQATPSRTRGWEQ